LVKSFNNLVSILPEFAGSSIRYFGDKVVINKALASCSEAVANVFDGATIMIGGFGEPGVPGRLIEALRQQGASNLVVIHNGAGFHDFGLGGLIKDGRVRKLVASFPNYPSASAFRDRYLKRETELELVPQGTLIERIRAAGARQQASGLNLRLARKLVSSMDSDMCSKRRCTRTSPF
jgi:acyl CoA:acetate/3-ketoacid CoA transferase alpha subunit